MPTDNDKGDEKRKGRTSGEIIEEGKGDSFKKENENFVQMNERRDGKQRPALDSKADNRKHEKNSLLDKQNEKDKDKEHDKDK